MKSLTGTPIATVKNSSGIPFNMRLVSKGQGYGRNLDLIHDNETPLVEFYDARYQFEGERGAEFGQFVSRYYLDTLMNGRSMDHGLNLDGGVPAWSIDRGAMRLIESTLRNWTS